MVDTTGTLKELGEEIDVILDTLDGIAPEDEQARAELAGSLFELVSAEREKVDASTRYRRWLDTQESHCIAESDRALAQAAKVRAKQQRFDNYLMWQMNARNVRKLEGYTSCITVRRNPGKVEILDELKIPPQYLVNKTQVVPNKKAIREAIDAGVEVPGARILKEESVSFK